MKPLQKSFFKKDAVDVAKNLLGKVIKFKNCAGIIVETEAYKSDAASHAFKRTERSEIMYSSYGKWYIYFIYGMYNCINITTNGKKAPGAVLIRAVEPIEGIKEMRKRRKTDEITNLCSGPGKLCAAFDVDRSLNSTDINDKIFVYDYKRIPKNQIVRTKRIGISKSVHLDWRFYVKNNQFVSALNQKEFK